MIRRAVLILPLALFACGSNEDANAGAHPAPAGDAGADAATVRDGAASPPDAAPDAAPPAALLPNPALVVASGAGEVAVLDPSSLRVVETFPVESGLHAHHLGVSPDGTRVLVTALSADFSGGHAMHGSDEAPLNRTVVYELDLRAGTLTAILDLIVTAHNAAYMPDDRNLVLAHAEHGMIQLYRTDDFEESWAAGTGPGPLEVTPSADGRDLVVCNSSDDSLSIVDVRLQEERARVEIAEGPVGAWRSEDGSFWVSSEQGRSVSLLAGDLEEVQAVIELDGVPGQAFETPDGAELWVALEDRGVVAVYDAESRELLDEIAAGDKPHGLTFEPSGARAFVTDEQGHELLVIDVAEREVVDRVTLGDGPNGVAWVER